MAAEQTMYNMVREPYVMDTNASRTIDFSAFIAPKVILVNNEVEKCSIKQDNTEDQYKKMVVDVLKTRS